KGQQQLRLLLNSLYDLQPTQQPADYSAAVEQLRWREGKLPEALQRCRAHPEWSSLNPGARLQDGERQTALDELQTELRQG
ncbi:hypothetical protein B2J73_20590, partial [Stutzerimonas stutzeri]|uniref:DUF3482 domain-containing protein n=1 Tax=Stutzerimonas stutzeri TaxID=316 RepID=UPI0009C6065A